MTDKRQRKKPRMDTRRTNAINGGKNATERNKTKLIFDFSFFICIYQKDVVILQPKIYVGGDVTIDAYGL